MASGNLPPDIVVDFGEEFLRAVWWIAEVEEDGVNLVFGWVGHFG